MNFRKKPLVVAAILAPIIFSIVFAISWKLSSRSTPDPKLVAQLAEAYMVQKGGGEIKLIASEAKITKISRSLTVDRLDVHYAFPAETKGKRVRCEVWAVREGEALRVENIDISNVALW